MSLENQILQPDFDAERYLGKWYEIAKLPTPFQQQCDRSIATYGLVVEETSNNENNKHHSKHHRKNHGNRHSKHSNSNSKDCHSDTEEAVISVYNQCFNNKGTELESILGTAKAYYRKYPAALTVSFPGFPAENGPNYLVHETDYISYAIVGSPNKDNLFILSRTPSISTEEYNKLEHKADYFGYDTNNLILDTDAVRKPCPCPDSESHSDSKSDSCTSTDPDPNPNPNPNPNPDPNPNPNPDPDNNNPLNSKFLCFLLFLILIALILFVVFPSKQIKI